MTKVLTTIERTSKKFNPIKVKLEFEIETLDEFINLKNEFTKGDLIEWTTAYSDIVHDVLKELEDLYDNV